MPHGCQKSNRPYSLNCKKAVWLHAGCLRTGYFFPDKLSPTQLDFLDQLNLVYVYVDDALLCFPKIKHTIKIPKCCLI